MVACRIGWAASSGADHTAEPPGVDRRCRPGRGPSASVGPIAGPRAPSLSQRSPWAPCGPQRRLKRGGDADRRGPSTHHSHPAAVTTVRSAPAARPSQHGSSLAMRRSRVRSCRRSRRLRRRYLEVHRLSTCAGGANEASRRLDVVGENARLLRRSPSIGDRPERARAAQAAARCGAECLKLTSRWGRRNRAGICPTPAGLGGYSRCATSARRTSIAAAGQTWHGRWPSTELRWYPRRGP